MTTQISSAPADYFKTIVLGTACGTHSVTQSHTDSLGNVTTDTTLLSIRGVYCSTAGDIKMTDAEGGTPTEFFGLVAGAVYPLCPTLCAAATGTSATLIALYG